MKNYLLLAVFLSCLFYFLKDTCALEKFNPIIQGKHPIHGKKSLKWDERKREVEVLNVKVGRLALLFLPLTRRRKYTRAISKWTHSRDQETRPIWKITFASGAQITDNLFVALVPWKYPLNYANTEENKKNIINKANIVK